MGLVPLLWYRSEGVDRTDISQYSSWRLRDQSWSLVIFLLLKKLRKFFPEKIVAFETQIQTQPGYQTWTHLLLLEIRNEVLSIGCDLNQISCLGNHDDSFLTQTVCPSNQSAWADFFLIKQNSIQNVKNKTKSIFSQKVNQTRINGKKYRKIANAFLGVLKGYDFFKLLLISSFC